jgi:tetratricopeptide (TPR) repeat protein
MPSSKENVLRKGIGFVLAAVATFALALALPVAAQDQSQGQSQSKSQGPAKSKTQGSGAAEKVKDKTKDSGDSFGYSKNYGDSYSQSQALDELTGKLSQAYALADQAQAMSFNYDASTLENLAKELTLESKLNFDNDINLNLQYALKLDSLGGNLFGQQDSKDRERDMERARGDREAALYSAGSQALDQGKWQVAEDRFDQVIEMKQKRADAGLFWKAYCQNKLGQRTEALATLTTMEKDYPKSRWLDDAKKLEVEVKQLSGRPVSPDTESDCELKLLALNGLQQADPAKAVPLLEKMMHNTDCVKIRSQALFVLAQSNSPEAREAITKMARGEGVNPLVQERAIQALGMYRAESGREVLAQIYSSSTDTDVKKAILRALMMSGDKARIFAAAKSEKDPELRTEAIRQLGMMNDRDDIWQLYQTETSVEVKKQILNSMWQSGDVDHVSQLAMNEKDPTLKIAAINALGMMDRRSATKGTDTLLAIYASDTNPDVRKKIISALYNSNDAKSLVALARKEADPELKKKIVSDLSNMKSPDATAYLLELLNK